MTILAAGNLPFTVALGAMFLLAALQTSVWAICSILMSISAPMWGRTRQPVWAAR